MLYFSFKELHQKTLEFLSSYQTLDLLLALRASVCASDNLDTGF